MDKDKLAVLDAMLTEAVGWPAYAAQLPVRRPGLGGGIRLPPVPYITRHVIEGWHVGLPYTQGDYTIVQARARISLVFVGPGAEEKAAAFSAWVRSPRGNEYLTIQTGQETHKPFYVLSVDRWSDNDRHVNQAWENRVSMDLVAQYHVVVSQPVRHLDGLPDHIDVQLET